MKLSADMLDCLNSIELRDQKLREVIHATIEAYAKGESNKLTGIITTLQFFENTPDRAKAIIFRLQAIGLMIQKDELKDWIQRNGAGIAPTNIQKALVSATAEHPLSIVGDDILFERESFLQRVLELAEPEGSFKN